MSEKGTVNFQDMDSGVYDRFMGRFSRKLAPTLADQAGVVAPMHALDVGCGPGELTVELVRRLGAGAVSACDPSSVFVDTCRERNPGVRAAVGAMEALPFDDNAFDASLAQLVLHFVGDPAQGMREVMRVTKPGGVIGASGWDNNGGMELLSVFGRAAATIAPPEMLAKIRPPFVNPGEIASLFVEAGLTDIEEREITVSASYTGFEDFWEALRHAPGPVAAVLGNRSEAEIATFREACMAALNNPAGAFSLNGKAYSAIGRVPS